MRKKPHASSRVEQPLVKIRRWRESKLYRYQQEQCNLCEKIFHNQYDLLVHNANHIIIPLTRQTFHLCTICRRHFKSAKNLACHNKKKHITKVPDIVNKKSKLTNILQRKQFTLNSCGDPANRLIVIIDDNENAKADLKNVVVKTSIDKCEDSVTQSIETCVPNFGDTTNDATKKQKFTLGSLVNQTPIVKVEDSLTQLLNVEPVGNPDTNIDLETKMTPLGCFVNQTPVVKLDDTVKQLLKANATTSGKTDPAKNDMGVEEYTILGSFVNQTPIVKVEDTVTQLFEANIITEIEKEPRDAEENITTNVITLDRFVVKTPLVKVDDTVTRLLKSTEAVQSLSKKFVDDDAIIEEVKGIDNKTLSIKDTIVFEDDEDEDDIMIFDDLEEDKYSKVIREEERDLPSMIVIGSKCVEENFVSVHYEDLIQPRKTSCRKCYTEFPNRYEAIIHETVHLNVKRRLPPLCTICDRYISGNYRSLNHHIDTKHGATKRNHAIGDCKKCHLKYYNYAAHERNYHLIYVCPRCAARFDSVIGRDKHIKEKCSKNDEFPKVRVENIGSPVQMKVCEMCCLFLKRTPKFKYVVVGDYSRVGERQTCARCAKDYFEVKLVKRIQWRDACHTGEHKKASINSNANRLKNIHNRLKWINKLAKF